MQRTKSDRKHLVLESEYVNDKLVGIKKKYPDNIAHAKAMVDKTVNELVENDSFAKKVISDKVQEVYSATDRTRIKIEIVNRL